MYSIRFTGVAMRMLDMPVVCMLFFLWAGSETKMNGLVLFNVFVALFVPHTILKRTACHRKVFLQPSVQILLIPPIQYGMLDGYCLTAIDQGNTKDKATQTLPTHCSVSARHS